MTDFEGRSRLVRSLGRAMKQANDDVVAIAREMFNNPEPAFAEHRASSILTGYLARLGYTVETGLAGLPTAFRANLQYFDSEAMRKGLRHGHIGILAEYDAGEGGHQYGRHLSAAGAMAIAAGLKRVLNDLHGEVTIIGCPAAATLEGKRILAGAGIFEAVDLVTGVRPMSTGLGFQPTINGSGETFGLARLSVRFDGDAGEYEARQRLATAVESRDHELSGHESIQPVLSENGVDLTIQADTNPGLERLIDLVQSLAGGVAGETDSTVPVDLVMRVPAGNVNRILARRIRTYADAAGLTQDRIVKSPPGAPDDWAYPSMVTGTSPARFPVSSDSVEIGTDAYAEASISEFAFEQMFKAANAATVAALDALGDMELRGFIEGELIRGLNRQGIRREPRRWLGVHQVLPATGANGSQPALGRLDSSRRG